MTRKIAEFCKSTFFKRILLYGVIAFMIYQLRGFTNLFLLLFFVTYIMNELCKFVHRQTSRMVRVSEELVTIIIYCLLILFFVLSGFKYVPEVVSQAKVLSKSFESTKDLSDSIDAYINSILTSFDPSLRNIVELYIFDFTSRIDEFSSNLAMFSYSFIRSIGIWVLNIFLMIILSFFFLIEKNKMKGFAHVLNSGRFSFIYNELQPVFSRFYRSFGSIVKAQLIISLVNMILTVTALACLKFSNLFAISVMLFLLGLIPAAGAIFSTIPLLVIGYGIGQLPYVLYVLVIVLIIHSLGTYIIFPKMLSNFTHLPIFIILIVLILSEHLFGPWGLIYGLPLFVFAIESLKHPDEPVVSSCK